jgi:outer membrane protein assembly factor BamE (lipoprotein component of BamABCDE complex)
MKIKLFLVSAALAMTGCTAGFHSSQVQQENINKLTLGNVQREIKVGLPSADVVSILGSPNILTTDEQRREVWVYDKISSNVSYSNNASGTGLLPMIIYGYGNSAGAAQTSEKTLTIIIKFDKENKVRDYSYHASTF